VLLGFNDASHPQIQKEICDDLFVLAEDWDAELLLSIVTRAEGLCVQQLFQKQKAFPA